MPIQTSSLTGKQFGTLPGAKPQGGAGTYGKVPVVPDPSATQGGAIAGNQGNLASLYGLTGSLNTEIANQAQLPYNLNLPNYQGMVGQSSQNILQNLQGQVPQDVANQIAQMAAERGVSTGSIGSPNANTALLRSLGLTSLGLQQQGEQNLSGAIARTPTGQQFNPQSFLVSPADQQLAQYMANLYAAAPTPGAGDRANLNALQQGLGGIGGPGGVNRGGYSPPGADFFGNVYTPAMGGGGVGGGTMVGGALGWPGGAQSGSMLPPGIPYNPGAGVTSSPWGGGYSEPPPNTYSTGTSSTYDPLSQYGGYGMGLGGGAGPSQEQDWMNSFGNYFGGDLG